jgi:hypothetical protein
VIGFCLVEGDELVCGVEVGSGVEPVVASMRGSKSHVVMSSVCVNMVYWCSGHRGDVDGRRKAGNW